MSRVAKHCINDESSIRAELLTLAEPNYRKFTSSLIPGCDNLIGVRIPAIRKIAKRIAKDDPMEYLNMAKDIYFEETMLKGLIIGNMKEDIETVLEQTSLFIPKITNWSLCDSFCVELKIIKEHQETVWEFLEPYWESDQTYEIRIAVVMSLLYYIDETHLQDLFYRFDHIHHQDYYVKMAVAWAVSMCFVKFPAESMEYLKNNQLDDETYHKALQKIRESLRVDKNTKEIIKGMKR